MWSRRRTPPERAAGTCDLVFRHGAARSDLLAFCPHAEMTPWPSCLRKRRVVSSMYLQFARIRSVFWPVIIKPKHN